VQRERILPEIKIRQAHPDDREAVLAFCSQTWEWGDYITDVWEKWLHDPAGLLLVAIHDSQPVGLVHLQMQSETDAWLEGSRVDPAYRKQGIATQLLLEAEAEAMRRGGTTVRLLTESVNDPSIHIVEQAHFQLVGTCLPYTAVPLVGGPKRRYSLDAPILAGPDDLSEIIAYLDASSIFPAVAGLAYSGLTAYEISDKFLREKLQAQQIYLLRRWERLDGLAIVEMRERAQEKYLFIGYIDGTTESISLIAYALRQKAAELGLMNVRANLPDLIMVRDAFTGAEYEWVGQSFYIYERGLV
jgi:GNAT superfamily N-acetyltransferase